MSLHTLAHSAIQWINPFVVVLGIATLAFTTLAFVRQATVYLLPSRLHRYNRTGNNWALVTGATDGIGFGFCQELCARGFNVILHGRNADKLAMRARELNAMFPDRKTRIVVRDVVGRPEGIDGVAGEVREIIGTSGGSLTVLVNNVGGETKPYTTLDELSMENVDATLAKNAIFMTQITRVLMPLFAEGSCGLVLNVSSIASYGLPYISVYSATKGYVDSFTRALDAECAAEKPGVEVMGLRVGQVKSAAFVDIEESLFVPSSRRMAKAGLDRVGCGKTIVWGYFWHWVQGLSFSVCPRWVLMKITTAKLMSLKREEQAKAKMR